MNMNKGMNRMMNELKNVIYGIRSVKERAGKRLKKGFSMSEVLIAVAIMAVLFAVGTPAIISLRRTLKLRELDDCARQIYLAAQNQLTAQDVAGKLEKYKSAPASSSTTASSAASSTDTGVWYTITKDSSGNDIIKVEVKDATKSTSSSSASGSAAGVGSQSTGNNSASASQGNKEDYIVLALDTIEGAIAKNSYSINISFDTATVNEVLYSEPDNAGSDKGVVLTAENSPQYSGEDNEATRKAYYVGEYSSASVGGARSKISYLPISLAIKDNEATIEKVVDGKTTKVPDGELRLEVKLTDLDKTKLKSRYKAGFTNALKNSTVTLTVKIQELDTNGVEVEGNEVTLLSTYSNASALKYNTDTNPVSITLDSLAGIKFKEVVSTTGKADPEKIHGTINPGADVKITVVASIDTQDSKYGFLTTKASISTNSLFESIAVAEVDSSKDYTYDNTKNISTCQIFVSNPRHLQNLSTAVSGANMNALIKSQTAKTATAAAVATKIKDSTKWTVIQSADIDWAETENYTKPEGSTFDGSLTPIYNAAVLSYINSAVTDDEEAADGTSENTSTNTGEETTGGTADDADNTETEYWEIRNLQINKSATAAKDTSNTSTYVGLFGKLVGTNKENAAIKNVRLVNLVTNNTIAANYCGGLAGYTEYAKVENCTITLDEDASENRDDYKEEFKGYAVGGMIGECMNPVSLKDCSVTGVVQSFSDNAEIKHYFGGLIGRIYRSSSYSATSDTELHISNCQVINADQTFATNNSESKEQAAGGLVGGIQNSSTALIKFISEDSSGNDITSKVVNTKQNLKALYAGGVFGIAKGYVEISKCTVLKDDEADDAYVNTDYHQQLEGKRIGGILGYARATSNGKVCIHDCSIEDLRQKLTTTEAAGVMIGNATGESTSESTSIRTEIKNCSAINMVPYIIGTKKSNSGGLIGKTSLATVEDCQVYAEYRDENGNAVTSAPSSADESLTRCQEYQKYALVADLETTGCAVGGLIGGAASSTIKNSFASLPSIAISTTTDAYVGGLAGRLDGTTTLTSCYADTGLVAPKKKDANSYVTDKKGNVELCWYSAAATENKPAFQAGIAATDTVYAGGLVGAVASDASVTTTNCYSTGYIAKAKSAGGFAGKVSGSLTVSGSCYAFVDLEKYTRNTDGTYAINADGTKKVNIAKVYGFAPETPSGTGYRYWKQSGCEDPELTDTTLTDEQRHGRKYAYFAAIKNKNLDTTSAEDQTDFFTNAYTAAVIGTNTTPYGIFDDRTNLNYILTDLHHYGDWPFEKTHEMLLPAPEVTFVDDYGTRTVTSTGTSTTSTTTVEYDNGVLYADIAVKLPKQESEVVGDTSLEDWTDLYQSYCATSSSEGFKLKMIVTAEELDKDGAVKNTIVLTPTMKNNALVIDTTKTVSAYLLKSVGEPSDDADTKDSVHVFEVPYTYDSYVAGQTTLRFYLDDVSSSGSGQFKTNCFGLTPGANIRITATYYASETDNYEFKTISNPDDSTDTASYSKGIDIYNSLYNYTKLATDAINTTVNNNDKVKGSTGEANAYYRVIARNNAINANIANNLVSSAKIASCRHLQNLDATWSEVSYTAEKNGTTTFTATQIRDIDWSNVTYTDANGTHKQSFVPILNTALTTYTNQHTTDTSNNRIYPVIENLYITSTGKTSAGTGLFAEFSFASAGAGSISGVRLVNPLINLSNTTGALYAGGLCGIAKNIAISDCQLYMSDDDTASYDYNNYTMKTPAMYMGGLVGCASGGTVTTSSASWPGMESTSGGYIGGLIGTATGSVAVSKCYADTGLLETASQWKNGIISSGNGYAGGFAGQAETGCSFVNCYSMGYIAQAGIAAGFAADGSFTADHCYSYVYMLSNEDLGAAAQRYGFTGGSVNTGDTSKVYKFWALGNRTEDDDDNVANAVISSYFTTLDSTWSDWGNNTRNQYSGLCVDTRADTTKSFEFYSITGLTHYGDWANAGETTVTVQFEQTGKNTLWKVLSETAKENENYVANLTSITTGTGRFQKTFGYAYPETDEKGKLDTITVEIAGRKETYMALPYTSDNRVLKISTDSSGNTVKEVSDKISFNKSTKELTISSDIIIGDVVITIKRETWSIAYKLFGNESECNPPSTYNPDSEVEVDHSQISWPHDWLDYKNTEDEYTRLKTAYGYLEEEIGYGEVRNPLYSPTRQNYKFLGWETTSGNWGDKAVTALSFVMDEATNTYPENKTLYAKWEAGATTHTVTVYDDSGSETPIYTSWPVDGALWSSTNEGLDNLYDLVSGKILTPDMITVITPDGFEEQGVYYTLSPETGNVESLNIGHVTKDTVIVLGRRVALYDLNDDKLVDNDIGDAGIVGTDRNLHTLGELYFELFTVQNITLPEFTYTMKEGKQYPDYTEDDDWTLEPDNYETKAGDESNMYDFGNSYRTRFYAFWDPIDYEITYVLNGGAWEDESVVKTQYDADLVPMDVTGTAVRTGYTFAGWYTSGTFNLDDPTENRLPYKTGSTTVQQIQTFTGPITLYARFDSNLKYVPRVNKVTTLNAKVWLTGETEPDFPASGGAAVTAAESIMPGATAKSATAKGVTGYDFVNWTDEDGNIVGTDLALSEANLRKDEDGNYVPLTYYANFKLHSCVITFAKGGDDVKNNMPDQTIYYNQKTSLQANAFIREGYLFNGWKDTGTTPLSTTKTDYKDTEEVTLDNATVTAVTLTAQWKEDNKYVTFVLNNNSASLPSGVSNPVVVHYGKTVRSVIGDSLVTEMQNLGVAGNQKFAGWYQDDKYTKEFNFSQPIKEDIKVYAKWLDQCTVTFYSDEPSVSSKEQVKQITLYEGEILDPNDIPGDSDLEEYKSTKYYTFGGWYESGSTTAWTYSSTPITENLDLYAHWTERIFKLRVNIEKSDNTVYTEEKEYTVSDINNNTNIYVLDQNFLVNTIGIYYEGWYEYYYIHPDNVTVIEGNNTSVTIEDKYNEQYGFGKDTVADENVIKTITGINNKQSGWYTTYTYMPVGCGGSYYIYGIAGRVTEDTTLNVKGTSHNDKNLFYTVTFNLNGVTAEPVPLPQTVESGKTATEPDPPVADDYDFIGWYTTAKDEEHGGPGGHDGPDGPGGHGGSGSSSSPYDFNTAVTKDITLYARWTESKGKATVKYEITGISRRTEPTYPTYSSYYSVKYDAAYNSESKKYEYTIPATSVAATPTWNNSDGATATFDGWYTDTGFTSTKYTNGSTVSTTTKDATITLYPRWKVSVNYDLNGGSAKDSSKQSTFTETKTLDFNGKIGTLPEVVRENYEFLGWSKTAQPTDVNDANYLNIDVFDVVNDEVTENMTLHAWWRKLSVYRIYFLGNGNDNTVTMEPLLIDVGSSGNLPKNLYTKAGYACPTEKTWYTDYTNPRSYYKDQQTGVSFDAEEGTNIYFYANWEKQNYTATFTDLVTGTDGSTTRKTIRSETYTIDAAPNYYPAAQKDGYIFKGWKVVERDETTSNWINNVLHLGEFPSGMYGDVTFEAVWTALPELTLTVEGDELTPDAVDLTADVTVPKFEKARTGATYTLELNIYELDASGEVQTDKKATIELSQTYDPTTELNFTEILDSLTGTTKFKDIAADITKGAYVKVECVLTVTEPATNSKGEAVADKTITGTVRASDITNSLFAYDGDSGIGTGTNNVVSVAKISNARHLQNLHPEYSGVGTTVTEAKQYCDIIWPYATQNFIPITNTALTKYEGDTKTITSLTVNTAGNAGMFGTVSGSMTIQNLRLNDCSIVSSGANAGSFVGEAILDSGETLILNTVLATKTASSAAVTSNNGAAGGLIGSASGGTVKITNSAAGEVIYATGNAGGLIGTSNTALTVQNSYASGHTSNQKYSTSSWNINGGASAGGLIGSASGSLTMSQSFSAASVTGTAAAGGVIGTCSVSTGSPNLNYVYVIAPVNGTGRNNTMGYSKPYGAFIGSITGKITNTDCYYLPEVYEELYGDCDYTTTSAGLDASTVAFLGGSDPKEESSAMSRVELAYYLQKDLKIAATVIGMQARTFPFDTALDGAEYPYATWTSHTFNAAVSSGEGTYYGDWQIIEDPSRKQVTITFDYIHPAYTEQTIVSMKDETLGTQSITWNTNNTVYVPNMPVFGSYSVKSWKLYDVSDPDNPREIDTSLYSKQTTSLQIQAAACTTDILARGIYGKDSGYATIFYFYDRDNPTGEGETHNFELLRADKIAINTKYKEISTPVRYIANHYLYGWFDGTNFTTANKLRLGDQTAPDTETVQDDIRAYAKYESSDTYLVTVDYVYQMGEGAYDAASAIKITNVSSITSTTTQYRIREVNGQTVSRSLPVYELKSGYNVTKIMTVKVSGSDSASITMAEDKKTVSISADSAAEFVVVYCVEPLKWYKVECALEDTSSTDGKTYKSGETYTAMYNRDGTLGSEGDLYGALEEGFPNTSFVYIDGYTRITGNTGYVMDDDGVTPKVQKTTVTTDSGTKEVEYYTVHLDFGRKKYILTYDLGGGTCESDPDAYTTEYKLFGDTLTEPKAALTKDGYEMTGWTLLTDKSVEIHWGDTMPAGKVTATANWIKSTASFTVVYMYENAEDDDYTYVGSFTATAEQDPDEDGKTILYPEDYADQKSKFSDRYPKTEFFIYNEDEGEDNPNKPVELNPDGSTILYVYFKRAILTATFKYDDEVIHTITAKYGADVSDQWPQETDSTKYRWHPSTARSGVYQASIGILDDNYTFIGYLVSTRSKCTAEFWVELLKDKDGNYITTTENVLEDKNGKKYTYHHSDSFNGSSWIVTDEDHYAIDGFTYDHTEGDTYGSTYYFDEADFFYTRNSYYLDLYVDGELDSKISVQYGANITDYVETPTQPTGRYEFSGWHEDPELEVDFAFEKGGVPVTMPWNAMALYSGWIGCSCDVVMWSDSKDASPAPTIFRQTTCEWGTAMGTDLIDELPTKTDYAFSGWCYYDSTGKEQPFGISDPVKVDEGETLNLYPVWLSDTKENLKTVTVKYRLNDPTTGSTDTPIYQKDPTTGQMVAVPDSYVENCYVGEPVLIESPVFDGYIAERLGVYFYVTEKENPDDPEEADPNVVTLYYTQVQSWTYTLEYWLCCDPVTDVPVTGYTLETAKKEFLIYRDLKSSENYYEAVQMTLPDGMEDCCIYKYEYLEDGVETPVESGTSTFVTISPSENNKAVTLKFYIQPQNSVMNLNNRYASYGDTVASEQITVRGEANTSKYVTEYEGTVNTVKFIELNRTIDPAPKNVGTYPANAYFLMTVNGVDTTDTSVEQPAGANATYKDYNFLLKADVHDETTGSGSVYLQINKRKYVFTSETPAEAEYDPDSYITADRIKITGDLVDSTASTDYIAYTDLDNEAVRKKYFPEGEGFTFKSTVSAFRKTVGTTPNVYEYQTVGTTDLDNYSITANFGELSVYWNYYVSCYCENITDPTTPEKTVKSTSETITFDESMLVDGYTFGHYEYYLRNAETGAETLIRTGDEGETSLTITLPVDGDVVIKYYLVEMQQITEQEESASLLLMSPMMALYSEGTEETEGTAEGTESESEEQSAEETETTETEAAEETEASEGSEEETGKSEEETEDPVEGETEKTEESEETGESAEGESGEEAESEGEQTAESEESTEPAEAEESESTEETEEPAESETGEVEKSEGEQTAEPAESTESTEGAEPAEETEQPEKETEQTEGSESEEAITEEPAIEDPELTEEELARIAEEEAAKAEEEARIAAEEAEKAAAEAEEAARIAEEEASAAEAEAEKAAEEAEEAARIAEEEAIAAEEQVAADQAQLELIEQQLSQVTLSKCTLADAGILQQLYGNNQSIIDSLVQQDAYTAEFWSVLRNPDETEPLKVPYGGAIYLKLENFDEQYSVEWIELPFQINPVAFGTTRYLQVIPLMPEGTGDFTLYTLVNVGTTFTNTLLPVVESSIEVVAG